MGDGATHLRMPISVWRPYQPPRRMKTEDRARPKVGRSFTDTVAEGIAGPSERQSSSRLPGASRARPGRGQAVNERLDGRKLHESVAVAQRPRLRRVLREVRVHERQLAQQSNVRMRFTLRERRTGRTPSYARARLASATIRTNASSFPFSPLVASSAAVRHDRGDLPGLLCFLDLTPPTGTCCATGARWRCGSKLAS